MNERTVFKIIKRIKDNFSKKRINPGRRIAGGFTILILVGALLLMLPISSRTREFTPFLTALFTATSATCVTGLSLVNVGAYFSLFGQIVLLILIQLGGLGFMTVLCIAFFASDKQIDLRDRMMIAQTMGTESLEGIVKLVQRVLLITGIVELAGAALLSVRFIPRVGIIKGIWYGIFHSVSAFCNAGFDVIGDGKSMFSFRNDPIVLLTLAALIIIGGLGFIVWNDIIKKKSWKKLGVYSKIVILSTVMLILLGGAVYFILEYQNPETMGSDTTAQRILSSFFQSVTTRTAGFDALKQDSLTDLSKLWGIVLMMIGGASGSTAGGVKIGTIMLVLITLHTVLRAKPDVVILNRSIKHRAILHAMSILVLWLILVVLGSALVSIADNQPVLNSMYEVASAYSTVGLSVGVTETASVFTKILLIIYMFFGRIGIMTISVIFISGAGNNNTGIKYPESDFFIG